MDRTWLNTKTADILRSHCRPLYSRLTDCVFLYVFCSRILAGAHSSQTTPLRLEINTSEYVRLGLSLRTQLARDRFFFETRTQSNTRCTQQCAKMLISAYIASKLGLCWEH